MSDDHDPERVLEAILATKPRPQKVRNLQAIHELCREQYQAGSRDFSVLAIGKLCEAREVLKARGLYNEPAADYRKLIDAWARLAGPAPLKRIARQSSIDDYIERIVDPAARMIVQTVSAERNKLQAQLNTLKAAKTIVVDRRPAVEGPRTANAAAGLTDSELKALKKAVSLAFLNSQGWEELKFGEIVNERGRTIFDPGFASGLRKLLGE